MDNGLWCSKAIHERKSLIMTLPQLKHKLRCISAWREIRSQLLKSIGGSIVFVNVYVPLLFWSLPCTGLRILLHTLLVRNNPSHTNSIILIQ